MDTTNYTTTNSTMNVNSKENEKGKEEKGGRKEEEIQCCEKEKIAGVFRCGRFRISGVFGLYLK